MKKIIAFMTASLLVIASQFSLAADANTFSEAQQQDIQKIVHQYLLEHPEVLMEASKALQLKQVKDAITNNAKRLFSSRSTPVAGNKLGSINIVEFFDYQCPHCRKMVGAFEKIMKHNPEVRIVFKELPIFGASSQFASSAALAADKQGKYLAFHNALMQKSGRLSEKDVLDVAKSVGLNLKQLKEDMKSHPILNELKENYLLADSLGIQGTPAFIVGRYPSTSHDYHFIPGATTAEELQKAINDVSKSS